MFSAIGLNLIASVVFAVVYSLVSVRSQEKVIEAEIDHGFAELSRELTNQFIHSNSRFTPTATYQPLDPAKDYGFEFNNDLSRSMERTSFYAFRAQVVDLLPPVFEKRSTLLSK